jgi:hypothetical protein
MNVRLAALIVAAVSYFAISALVAAPHVFPVNAGVTTGTPHAAMRD